MLKVLRFSHNLKKVPKFQKIP